MITEVSIVGVYSSRHHLDPLVKIEAKNIGAKSCIEWANHGRCIKNVFRLS